MSTLRCFLLLCLSALLAAGARAQISGQIDSLRALLPATDGEGRVALYRKLSSHYDRVNRDSSRYYLDQMAAYAAQIGDRRNVALAELLIGEDHYTRGHYPTAQTYNERALAYFTATDDTAYLARTYLNIGAVADAAGEKDRAVENYLTATRYFDALRDSVNVAYLYLNIGLVFKSLENYDKAERYYADARALLTRLGDDFGLATVDNNTGSLLVEVGRYDSAYHYAERSQRRYAALGYSLYEGYSLGVMADASRHQNELRRAEQLYRQCVDIYAANEMHEDLFTVYVGLCEVYAGLGRPAARATAAARALAEAELTGSYEDLRDAARLLYEIYKERGDDARALTYHEQYRVWDDSVGSVAKAGIINELETRFRTELKERQITEQKLEIQTQQATIAQKQSQLVGLGGGALLLSLVGLVLYQRQRFAARARLQASVIAEKEKSFAAVVSATEAERKRVSQDLHDGVGQQLSAIRLGLQHLGDRTADEATRAELTQLTHAFSRSAEDVRELSHRMMPRALMQDGLRPAVEDLLRQSFRYAGTEYSFVYRNLDERFPEQLEVTFYRVLQELVNNVLKHAAATQVDVQLYRTGERLVLLVQDDGQGMSQAADAGHGLLNIRQRLALIGGRVNWSSPPGEGTLVTVTAPLP